MRLLIIVAVSYLSQGLVTHAADDQIMTLVPVVDPVEHAADHWSHSFGKVLQGTQCRHEFTLTNRFGVPIAIRNIIVPCGHGITRAIAEKTTLQPGESCKLSVSMDTKRFIGLIGGEILVNVTGDKVAVELKLATWADSVTETSESAAEMLAGDKKHHDFGTVIRGQRPAHEFMLTNRWNVPIKITSVYSNICSHPFRLGEIEKHELAPNESCKLPVMLDGRLGTGSRGARVWIRVCGEGLNAEAILTVSAKIENSDGK